MTFTLILIGFILLVGTVIETIPIVVLAPTLIKVSVPRDSMRSRLRSCSSSASSSAPTPGGIVYFTAAFIAEEPLEKVAGR